MTATAESAQPSTSGSGERTHRRSSSEKDYVIFTPDCIICGSKTLKAIKKKGTWTTQELSTFQSDYWKSVLAMAEIKKDDKLLMRISGFDLFACEAKFHRKCINDYMQDPEKWRSQDENARQEQISLSEAHQKAFADVCQVVQAEVFQCHKVVRLSHLQQIYTTSLEETDHANPNYRNENLKTKLIKQFADQLIFCDMGMPGQFQSSILFSSSISIGTAVRQAYMLGTSDTVENVGTSVRTLIHESFEQSPALKWPPTPQDMDEANIPEDLVKLLSVIICGKAGPTHPTLVVWYYLLAKIYAGLQPMDLGKCQNMCPWQCHYDIYSGVRLSLCSSIDWATVSPMTFHWNWRQPLQKP